MKFVTRDNAKAHDTCHDVSQAVCEMLTNQFATNRLAGQPESELVAT